MNKLLGLIDDYKSQHGHPSDASIARAIGVAPQTLNSWRARGIRALPAPGTLQRLADFLKVEDMVVFKAAGTDAGYLRS